MNAWRRLVEKDPADRQIAFLAIGAYSGCFLSGLLVLIAMASQGKFAIGLIIAGIILVTEIPLSNWMVKSARKRQASRQSDSTPSREAFSRFN